LGPKKFGGPVPSPRLPLLVDGPAVYDLEKNIVVVHSFIHRLKTQVGVKEKRKFKGVGWGVTRRGGVGVAPKRKKRGDMSVGLT
jgi:hypothetical protein